ncbi:hypothetical protein ACSBM8_03780 [Sphingomonas sp. ASY06-1R]|uniref:hypothetical protein n=1 Tax=Sphingomonas sp. ASY06-1R TaxID=3445771 RepID=UPI003FA1CA0A
MQEPSVRTSRLAIAGGLSAALLVGAAGFLIGRATVAPAPVPVVVQPARPAAPSVAEPDGGRLLDRGDLAAFARQAADALASGGAAPADVRDLPGRRFSLSLPFGCGGPADSDSPAPLRWRYDEASQTLRVHVALIAWQPDEWGMKAQAMPQGFWVTRPWSSAETCPAHSREAEAIGTDPVTLPGQTLAMVGFDAAPRGDGGYEAVLRVPRDQLDVTQGLRARVTGRIGRIPGDGAVRCVQPAGIEQQPICAIAAIFDELVVDNPATNETLARWTIGKVGEQGANTPE